MNIIITSFITNIIIDVAGDLDPTIQTPIDITVDAPSPLNSSKVVNHLRSNNIGKMKFYIDLRKFQMKLT